MTRAIHPTALFGIIQTFPRSFPGGSDDKESACDVGDLGSIPGLGRSHGEGKGCPLQHSCLENPLDRGNWWAIVHGVVKSWTRLSDWHFQTPLRPLQTEESAEDACGMYTPPPEWVHLFRDQGPNSQRVRCMIKEERGTDGEQGKQV